MGSIAWCGAAGWARWPPRVRSSPCSICPGDVLLALGICAVIVSASTAAVIRADARSTLSMSAALSASAVAVAVADTLKADLASVNIPIEVLSKGSADPIASNDAAEGRQLNRRVAIITS